MTSTHTGGPDPKAEMISGNSHIPNTPVSPARSHTFLTQHKQLTQSTLCEISSACSSSKAHSEFSKSVRRLRDTQSFPNQEAPKRGCSDTLNSRIEALNDLWVWEVLSCVVAVLCLVAIIVLLAVYHGRPLPELPALISLNSMVAVLTTMMKAALMVPVSQGVSQLKWLWFREPHSLVDMDDFDNASRGPWGSFLLMLSPRKHYLASFGAFIAVVALAIDPFSQQIIQFYGCYDVEGTMVARIPRTNNFTEGGTLTTPFNAELYGPMQAAIYHSILSDKPAGSASTLVSFDCRSGNCTFPSADDGDGATFQTLGLCHSCRDSSALIRRNASQPSWYVEGFPTCRVGLVKASKDQPWTMVNTKTTLPSQEAMDELVRFHIIMLKQGTVSNNCVGLNGGSSNTSASPPPGQSAGAGAGVVCAPEAVAMTCTIAPCVRTYHAEIRAGVLDERVLASEPLRKTNASDPNVVNSTTSLTFSLATGRILQDGAWRGCARSPSPSELTPVAINATSDTLYLAPTTSTTSPTRPAEQQQQPPSYYTEPGCVWSMGYASALAINRFVATLFDKTLLSQSADEFAALEGPIWLKNAFAEGRADLVGVGGFVGALADAATAAIRQQRTPAPSSASSSSSADGGGGGAAEGAVVVAQTCVFVRWAWLSLPGALVCMAMLFLGATAARCARTGTLDGAWRSSSLAPFFHGLDPGTRAGLGDVGRQSEMVDAARGIRVRVSRAAEEGGRGRQELEVVTVVSRRGTFCTTAESRV